MRLQMFATSLYVFAYNTIMMKKLQCILYTPFLTWKLKTNFATGLFSLEAETNFAMNGPILQLGYRLKGCMRWIDDGEG